MTPYAEGISKLSCSSSARAAPLSKIWVTINPFVVTTSPSSSNNVSSPGISGSLFSSPAVNVPTPSSFALIAVFFTTKGILWQWLMWTCYSSTLTAIWTLNYIEGSTSGLLYIVLNCIYIVVNFYCLFTWMVIKKKQDKESKEITQEEAK